MAGLKRRDDVKTLEEVSQTFLFAPMYNAVKLDAN